MLLFPDVERETRQYLLETLEPRWPGLQITPQQPAEGTDWQLDKPTMLVLTVSGPGTRMGVVYERVLLGVEAFAPTHAQASQLIGQTRAVLEDWSHHSGMVAGYSDNARPTRSTPDAVSYPRYWYSANILFKASTI